MQPSGPNEDHLTIRLVIITGCTAVCCNLHDFVPNTFYRTSSTKNIYIEREREREICISGGDHDAIFFLISFVFLRGRRLLHTCADIRIFLCKGASTLGFCMLDFVFWVSFVILFHFIVWILGFWFVGSYSLDLRFCFFDCEWWNLVCGFRILGFVFLALGLFGIWDFGIWFL